MPAPRSAHTLGEVALRHDLEVHLSAAVQTVEHIRIRLAGKRTNHLADPGPLDQCAVDSVRPGETVTGPVQELR
jgi:hypothetical protein